MRFMFNNTSKLEQDGLDLNDGHGQTYDNIATMAGKISGVQKHIEKPESNLCEL